jgi:tetratricopeptide (TPR) repeat protein
LICASLQTAGAFADDSIAKDSRSIESYLAIGTEVVLASSDALISEGGHSVSGQDQLIFLVELVDARRVRIVSRDKSVRGWVDQSQLVAIDQADKHFDRIVANDPRDADAFWIHARVLHYQRDFERALANANRAIRLDPGRACYYLTRAMVQLDRNQSDRAIEDCDQAIRINPTVARSYAIRAEAWIAKNDFVRARADLELAFKIDPVDPASSPRPATTESGTEKTPSEPLVVKTSAGSRPIEPQSAPELVKQGEDRLASNDYDRALADFNEALRINPDYAPAFAARAQAWARKHYREREIADITEAIKRAPNNPVYLVARGESWSAQGMHKSAMADFEQALRMEPNNPAFWVARGNEWRRHLKLDEALSDYTRAIQIDPRFAAAYIARGNTWKQRRVFDRSIQEFTELIRIDPSNALAHMTLARILATTHESQFRNGAWAVDEATRACELTRWRDPDCLDTLAAACAEKGEYDVAIKWQNQAIKLVRQNVPSLLQQKAANFGGRRGIGFEDRLVFYKSKRPTRE